MLVDELDSKAQWNRHLQLPRTLGLQSDLCL